MQGMVEISVYRKDSPYAPSYWTVVYDVTTGEIKFIE